MNDPIQEIKSKLDIVSLVQRYVPLKKAGRYFKACCPFHQEKTPSFFVNPDRQIAYCFSCQKGGDQFQFVQQIESLDFRGALELLAEMTGVELSQESNQGQQQKKHEKKEKKQRLLELHEQASMFFEKQLWQEEDGAKVRAYLASRGFNEASIKAFRLGFAPASPEALSAFLLKQGFSQDECLDSGLSVGRQFGQSSLADRFQLRLMIPIFDVQSRLIAFGGRALKQGEQAKYLNSPETLLYDKGATLFYLDQAKGHLRQGGPLCIVEGYFDVMASVQAGIPAVVASCGTALSAKQFQMMKRYTPEIILALDADKAGHDAMLRALEVAVPMGFHVKILRIQGSKDAAELAKDSPDLWRKALDEAKHWLQFFHEFFQIEYPLTTVEGQKNYAQSMLQMIAWSSDPVEKEFFLKEMAKSLEMPIDYLHDKLKALQQNTRTPSRKIQTAANQDQAPALSKDKKRLQKMIQESMALLLLFTKEFFEVLSIMKQEPHLFVEKVKEAGLLQKLHLLTPELLHALADDFGGLLEHFAEEAGFYQETLLKNSFQSIYKQIETEYTSHALLSSEWIQSLDTELPLASYAFELELQNLPAPEASKQCFKMLALLSLHFQTNHGKNS